MDSNPGCTLWWADETKWKIHFFPWKVAGEREVEGPILSTGDWGDIINSGVFIYPGSDRGGQRVGTGAKIQSQPPLPIGVNQGSSRKQKPT